MHCSQTEILDLAFAVVNFEDTQMIGKCYVGLTRVCVGVSGQGALRSAVTSVPVPASSSVSPLLGHHPLQGVVVQPHAPARAAVDQAGGGATHGTGVGDGL